MTEPAPRVYLFYGDDDLAIGETIAQLRANLGEAAAAELNFSTFSGLGLDFGRFEGESLSAPFLAPRRLIVLHDAQRAVSDASARERMTRLLESLPETTALVLVDPSGFKNPKDEQAWQAGSALYQWTEVHPAASYVRAFPRPTGPAFARWIADRCGDLGGSIEPRAAHLLSELVAEDMHLASRELEKLIDYVNGSRTIEAEDVERLTPYHSQTNVFHMVDAIGERQGRKAMALLHQLLQEEDPGYAFAMIVRQFRMILQALEARRAGIPPERALHAHPFVASKVAAQARNFGPEQATALYKRLLAIDIGNKTGKVDLDVELDRLLADLSR